MTPQKTLAIQTALTGNWEKAIELNKEILVEEPDEIDTLNRLAFAYATLGKANDARAIYQKVLELDSQNLIALKNIKRLSAIGDKTNGNVHVARNNVFIEESGKTKVLDLLNIAEQKVVSQLQSGEQVQLQVKRNKIFVVDHNKQYIGMLPDDLGKRLIIFIEGGNEYEAFVKTLNSHKVTIFIRESKRATEFLYQPSFIFTDKSKLQIDNKASRHAAKHQDEEEDKDSGSDDDEPETELL